MKNDHIVKIDKEILKKLGKFDENKIEEIEKCLSNFALHALKSSGKISEIKPEIEVIKKDTEQLWKDMGIVSVLGETYEAVNDAAND